MLHVVKPEYYTIPEVKGLGQSEIYIQELEFPTRLVVADAYGRIVVDSKFHPTDLNIPTVIPEESRPVIS